MFSAFLLGPCKGVVLGLWVSSGCSGFRAWRVLGMFWGLRVLRGLFVFGVLEFWGFRVLSHGFFWVGCRGFRASGVWAFRDLRFWGFGFPRNLRINRVPALLVPRKMTKKHILHPKPS